MQTGKNGLILLNFPSLWLIKSDNFWTKYLILGLARRIFVDINGFTGLKTKNVQRLRIRASAKVEGPLFYVQIIALLRRGILLE